MARVVRLESTGPIKIEPGSIPADKALWFCACGLSQTMPFCDKSHKITKDEQPGLLYVYSKDAKGVVETREDTAVKETKAGGDCSCGPSCCS